MATKEKTGRLGRDSHTREGARTGIRLMQLAEYGISLLLGALCASAEIFGRCTPFGLAMVAAAGAGIPGFCTLCGAVVGYLFFLGVSGGLHYVSACVLTYAISFALYDTRFREKKWLMPAVAACLCAVCRFLYLVGGGFGGADVIFFFTEPLLLFAAAYLYQGVYALKGADAVSLRTLTKEQRISLFALGATALMALSAVRFFGEFSLGRILAAAGVMLLAKGGVNAGLHSGILLGFSMDLASGKGPYYCMAYAVAGAACGLCSQRGRLSAALCYVAANGIAVLWTWESGMRIGLLYEVFAASVIFFLLPRHLREQTGALLALPAPPNTDWESTRASAVRHVRETAHAFRDLYESLRESLRPDVSPEDPATIFHCAAERECRKCRLRDLCWQKDYQTTQQALGDAMQAMLARGKAEGSDFPSHFRSRCIHFPAFLTGVNLELTTYLFRSQYHGRLKESRAALCRQYAEVDRILAGTAAEIAADFTPDLPREGRLRQFLRGKGLSGDGRVYYDEKGHLRVETPSSAQLRTEEGRSRLSSLLAVSLRPPEELDTGRLRFTQAEPFVATAGVSCKSKEGETVSGDTGTWFRREDGLLCILLCDGMGSGPAARQESGLAVRLLQSFLKAGVDPEAALGTVNAALSLRGEEGGFCTVDLLTIELYTGLCSLYKFGAAPTYLRKGDTLSCITGTALPAGLVSGEEAKPDISRFRAAPGDWILLLSDGMLSSESDEWLRESLLSYKGKSPGELAERLISGGESEGGGADDRTVIAVRLEKRT